MIRRSTHLEVKGIGRSGRESRDVFREVVSSDADFKRSPLAGECDLSVLLVQKEDEREGGVESAMDTGVEPVFENEMEEIFLGFTFSFVYEESEGRRSRRKA